MPEITLTSDASCGEVVQPGWPGGAGSMPQKAGKDVSCGIWKISEGCCRELRFVGLHEITWTAKVLGVDGPAPLNNGSTYIHWGRR